MRDRQSKLCGHADVGRRAARPAVDQSLYQRGQRRDHRCILGRTHREAHFLAGHHVDAACSDHRTRARQAGEAAACIRGHRITRAILARHRRPGDVAVDHVAVGRLRRPIPAPTPTTTRRQRQHQRSDGPGGDRAAMFLLPLAHEAEQGPSIFGQGDAADAGAAFEALLDQSTLELFFGAHHPHRLERMPRHERGTRRSLDDRGRPITFCPREGHRAGSVVRSELVDLVQHVWSPWERSRLCRPDAAIRRLVRLPGRKPDKPNELRWNARDTEKGCANTKRSNP